MTDSGSLETMGQRRRGMKGACEPQERRLDFTHFAFCWLYSFPRASKANGRDQYAPQESSEKCTALTAALPLFLNI